MAAQSLTQSLATYRYIDRPTVNLGAAGTTGTDFAALLQIQTLISAANAAFNSRQYATAISNYRAAESLIYAQIDTRWAPGVGLKFPVALPRDPALFDTLLSASAQWLNILQVPYPTSPVRPATAPAAELLASVASLEGAGLTTVSTNAVSTSAALADMHLATIYASQGNVAGSTALIARAKGLDAMVSSEVVASYGLDADALVASNAVAKPVVAVIQDAPVKPVGGSADPVAVAPRTTAATEPATVNPATVRTLSAGFVGLPTALLAQREIGLVTGSAGNYAVKAMQWPAAGDPDIPTIKNLLYLPRVSAVALPDALTSLVTLWEYAAGLPHLYFYVIPLAMGASYKAMRDYAKAETYYLAASKYTYINLAVEGPYVWLQLAALYLAWGDSSYQQGDLKTALSTYANVLALGTTAPPATAMYTTAGMATAAGIAKTLIPQLPTLIASGIGGVSADEASIATALLKVFARQLQINGNLNFWGFSAPTIPIWSFTYLQSVAINFTQLAQQVEQQVINFWSQADQASLTSAQLTGQAAVAAAQVTAAQQSVAQAQAQANAYQAALTLAQTRATDAASNASEYSNLNSNTIYYQGLAQEDAQGDPGANSGFDNLYGSPLPYGANGQITQGTINAVINDENFGDTTAAGVGANWVAAAYSQIYQVDSMNRTTTEMQQAATQAQAELTSASAQVQVAQANLTVAQLQANVAAQVVTVFDADNFSPQVWQEMGNFMLAIYEQYMATAMNLANLMQLAYNFENDESVAFIQQYYPGVIAWGNQPAGLLGADSLMADIQSFTNDLITATRGKKQLVKTSISLAGRYGYVFETSLRKTGTMTFETSLDDFDSEFPGSYEARIRSVSVSVQGLVPPAGLTGTLTNGGISLYRLPSDIASGTNVSKIRIQNVDTLVLSDYSASSDGVLDSTDGGQDGIFEGAGVASTWTLSLPPSINDLDYSTLTDVVLTFLYETRFDTQLVPTVLSQLASRPGFYSRVRTMPIAWYFPDLFYAFQSSGALTLTLDATDFPANQTLPVVSAISLLVSTTAGTSATGITVSIMAPTKTAASAVTDATGAITSQGAGAPLASSTGGSALGSWVIAITAAANPSLAAGGQLNLAGLNNLTLILDYTFTPRS